MVLEIKWGFRKQGLATMFLQMEVYLWCRYFICPLKSVLKIICCHNYFCYKPNFAWFHFHEISFWTLCVGEAQMVSRLSCTLCVCVLLKIWLNSVRRFSKDLQLVTMGISHRFPTISLKSCRSCPKCSSKVQTVLSYVPLYTPPPLCKFVHILSKRIQDKV